MEEYKEMKLSIITVNLNNAEGLRKTIESVISQTFTNYEYIIVDGGSTDGSVDIIKQYADKITYWVSEPDKGLYNAMNKGILQAKGEYCYFLNSGDFLVDSNVLTSIFSNNLTCNFITGNRILFGPIENGVDKSVAYKTKGKVTLLNMMEGTLRHQSTLIKRKIFDEYGLYNENYKIISDWILFLRAIGLNGEEVQYVNVNIAYFDTSGISRTQKELAAQERKEVITNYVPQSILRDYDNFFINIEIRDLAYGKFGFIIKWLLKTKKFARKIKKVFR